MRLKTRLQRIQKSLGTHSPEEQAMNEFLQLASAFNWNGDVPHGARIGGVVCGNQWWDRRRWEAEKHALQRSLPGPPDPQAVPGRLGIVVKVLGAGHSMDDL